MAERLTRVNVKDSPYVTANIVAYDFHNRDIAYLSLIGYSGALKTIGKLINEKNNVSIGSYSFTSKPKGYEIITSKQADSDFSHSIIFKKDTVSSDSGGTEGLTAFVYTDLPDSFAFSFEKVYPEVLVNAVYDKLYKHTPFPILREWMPYIITNLISSRALSTATAIKADDMNMRVFRLSFSFNYLSQLISSGLKNREIDIRGCETPSEEISAVTGLDSYLNTFTETLASKIQASFLPKFIPNEQEYSEALQDFADYTSLRGGLDLYDAQKAAIQSASLNLDKNGVSFIISEMGTGM